MSFCGQCGTEIPAGAKFCSNCGAPAPVAEPEAPLPVQETIGVQKTIGPGGTQGGSTWQTGEMQILPNGTLFADRFEITGVLGKGGMGVVYSAHDNNMNEDVALKLIRTDRVNGESGMKRLVEEGRTARRISHENIIRVFDVSIHDGQPFVVMEKLSGRSLRSWHRDQLQGRKDVPFKVAARIIAEILSGLQAAHKLNVVHRDLKPENIFLLGEPTENNAQVRILDFGIANQTAGASNSSMSSLTSAGTMGYMAPEQVDNAHLAGPEADLFSVSVMFYELLMQNRPSARWKPPSGARPDVPKAIDGLIEAGLSDYPKSRPQSAEAYLEQLTKATDPSWFGDLKNRYQKYEAKQSRRWAPFYRKLGYEWEDGQPFRYTKKNIRMLAIHSIIFAVVFGMASWFIQNGGDFPIGRNDSGGKREYASNAGTSSSTRNTGTSQSTKPQTTRSASINFTALSGPWESDASYWQVSVDNYGNFSGNGSSKAGYGQGFISGTIDRNGNTEFFVTYAAYPGAAATGYGRLVDGPDINYRLVMSDGSNGGNGTFHINHRP